MKPTPDENKIIENFMPGKISKSGFLGSDERHIHDIIEEDLRTLAGLGVDRDMIADKLVTLTEEGKKGIGGRVNWGPFSIRVQWDRGMVPCPFGEPGLHPKMMTIVFKQSTNKEIRYTQLGLHLIRKHGFFGGRGSAFRLEPEALVKMLEIVAGK